MLLLSLLSLVEPVSPVALDGGTRSVPTQLLHPQALPMVLGMLGLQLRTCCEVRAPAQLVRSRCCLCGAPPGGGGHQGASTRQTLELFTRKF